MRADRMHQRRVRPAPVLLQRLGHGINQFGKGYAWSKSGETRVVARPRRGFAPLVELVQGIERHGHLDLDFLIPAGWHQCA